MNAKADPSSERIIHIPSGGILAAWGPGYLERPSAPDVERRFKGEGAAVVVILTQSQFLALRHHLLHVLKS